MKNVNDNNIFLIVNYAKGASEKGFTLWNLNYIIATIL